MFLKPSLIRGILDTPIGFLYNHEPFSLNRPCRFKDIIIHGGISAVIYDLVCPEGSGKSGNHRSPV